MLQFGRPFLSAFLCFFPSHSPSISGYTRGTPPLVEKNLTSAQSQRSSTDSCQIVLKTAFNQTLLSVGLYAEAKLYLSRALPPPPQEISSKTT